MSNPKDSAAVRSLKREKAHPEKQESELQEALEDTFPASDPVSPASNLTSGAPKRSGKEKK